MKPLMPWPGHREILAAHAERLGVEPDRIGEIETLIARTLALAVQAIQTPAAFGIGSPIPPTEDRLRVLAADTLNHALIRWRVLAAAEATARESLVAIYTGIGLPVPAELIANRPEVRRSAPKSAVAPPPEP